MRDRQATSADNLASDAQPRPWTAAEAIAQLPAHLGWECDTYTQSVRQQSDSAPDKASAEQVDDGSTPKATSESEATVRVFGHVLDRLQREGWEGIGRVWLLLRFLDRQQGEGRVSLRLARHMLTGQHSAYRCLSWKRLRQLLNEGEGVLWQRDKRRQHVYYYSEARVAHKLGLKAIRGWAVEIGVRELCGSITAVRALFYDAFHSSRGDGFQKPITRHTLSQRGNGDSRTQRKYETLRGMARQASFATVGQYSKLRWRQAQAEDAEERIGGPAFIFVDYKGILGKNPHRARRASQHQHWHNIYIMRQIGNTYQGTLPTVKRGRRWTNRKLKHLCNSMSATGSFAVDEAPTPDSRMYYGTAVLAQKAAGRQQRERPSYWPRGQERVLADASGYWQEEGVPWAKPELALATEGAKKI